MPLTGLRRVESPLSVGHETWAADLQPAARRCHRREFEVIRAVDNDLDRILLVILSSPPCWACFFWYLTDWSRPSTRPPRASTNEPSSCGNCSPGPVA